MKEFEITKIKHSAEYDKLIICLTFESILNYATAVEQTHHIKHSSGKVIIDQLLVTGNSDNRFISCPYSNGKLDFTSAKTVKCSSNIRKLSTQLLQDNFSYLENSILSDNEKDMIKRGALL